MPQFYTVIVILGLCQVPAAIYQGCKNCGCCVDRVCSTSSRSYCIKGCIDGIYGDRCYHQCPAQCAACERNGRRINGVWTHDCTKCPDGKYLSNYIKDCSLSCPTTCNSCSSDTVCADCKFPYFNYGAVTNCSLYCPGNCECSESGTCLACKEGFFSPQSQCRSKCHSNCQSCSSLHTCDKCQTGFYNGIEFDSPNGTYFKDCRYSCRASCVDCLSYNLCYSCVPGTYGIHCEQTCSIGCKYGRCDKSNGGCECKKDFTGQQCNECVSGQYGKRCDKTCSSVCKNKECEKSDGQCVECVNDYFTDRHCSSCISGRYGSYCTLECPTNCNNSICKRYSGDCSQGCNENFAGDKCDACVSGKYGANCSLECPRNCQDNGCVRETGFCFGCKGNFKGAKCDKCKNGFYKDECSEVCKSNRCLENVCHREFGNCTACPNGYYGELCDTICSNGCFDRTCDIETGACSAGCLPHFSGDKCCVPSSSCEICKSNSECIQCRSGYYGNDCEMECPLTCNGNCNKESGICETCPPDMFGLFCNYSCPISCSYESGHRICNASSGHCLIGCVTSYFTDRHCSSCISGRYGSNCTLECPKNCNNSICERYSGDCSQGCNENFVGNKCGACVSGKYGENCSRDCPRNCQDNGCVRETGFCFGCKGNFKGAKCDKCKNGFYKDECSEVCKSKWCLGNICHREFGNCTACPDGYYGELCDKVCSNGCTARTCDIETGACLAGCQPHFSGDKCCVRSSSCELCKSNSECLKCKSGYHGVNCEFECPLTCNGKCDKESGICETCPPDMYGLFCNYSCPASCTYESSQRMCNASSGHCLIGCQNGYHGHTCEDNCGHNCVEHKCHRITGYCQIGCAEGFQGNVCSEETAAVSMAGPVAGGLTGMVVLAAGSIFGICFFRKRKKKEPKSNTNNNMGAAESVFNGETSGPNDVPFTELQTEDNDVDEDTEDTALDDTYYNMTTKIKISNLFSYVRNKTRESFKAEFTQLPKHLLKPCTFARRQENISKNRYNGMYPYDHSRVQINGDTAFFINACYIDGFKKDKEYIASLGPTKKTTDNFNTFWKMVWHEKSDVIVMLTNLTEPTGMKCEKYWPHLGESVQYDDVTAVCEKEEVFVEYTVRTFTLSKDKQDRTLIQFHYTAWPDKDVPDNVTSLIEFWQRVKMLPKKTEVPTIVHCSAGVGRTGTYIALDRLAEEGESNGLVDVYGCVMSMREQRVNMVQTLEQYIYLHKALCHSQTFDCHRIPAEMFIDYAGAMTTEELDSRYQEINQSLESVSNDEQQAITTHKSETGKNRTDADIPGDKYRPRIYLNRSFNDSDYINATNIDSFTKKNRFITTQTPLPTTVQDFLCLVYQENCPCIVSLEAAPGSGMDIGQYLPFDTQSIKVDCFTVSCIKSETRNQYTLKTLLIQNAGKQMPGEKTIYHYQYTKWKTGKSVPSNAGDFVQFVKDVETKSNSNNSENGSTILVHCLNGANRSGLFCAVAVLLEKIQMEYQVSIANTVRQIRWRRKTAIPNKEQFEFCYRCVSAHLELYNTYSNFDA